MLLLASPSNAQSNEIGMGGWHFEQHGVLIDAFDPGSSTGNINVGTEVNESNTVPGLSFLHYQPIYMISDILSAGAAGGANFFGYYRVDETKNFYGQTIARNSSGLFLAFQVPLYATLRFLNGSEYLNNEGFGAGTGIGAIGQGFEIPNEKAFMISPTFMFELKYDRVGARFEYLFKKFESHYTSSTGDIPRLKTSFFNILITYNFHH